jgi:hypothetical protein
MVNPMKPDLKKIYINNQTTVGIHAVNTRHENSQHKVEHCGKTDENCGLIEAKFKTVN